MILLLLLEHSPEDVVDEAVAELEKVAGWDFDSLPQGQSIYYWDGSQSSQQVTMVLLLCGNYPFLKFLMDGQ